MQRTKELQTAKYKCMMKRTFETETEALKEMKWLRIDKKYKKLKRAYKCNVCDKWHLTKRVKDEN
jgi:plasmid maintenance system killer protein